MVQRSGMANCRGEEMTIRRDEKNPGELVTVDY